MRKNNLIALINRLAEASNRFIVRELQAHAIEGIVPSHGDILALLFAEERLKMQDIALRIHRTKPTVTVLINKLVELGYVRKDKSETDSRVTYISLTEKGKAIRPAFETISEHLNALAYQGLDEADAVRLEKTIEAILVRYKQ